MCIGFGIERSIVVDDAFDIVDIETSGCDVGSYEDVHPVRFESADGPLPSVLGHVSVDGAYADALLAHTLVQVVDHLLCGAEYDHLGVPVGHYVAKNVHLAVPLYLDIILLDELRNE